MTLTLFENTYCTVEEANSILAGSPTWTGATAEQKEYALREATAKLDTYTWQGVSTDPTQPLAWPRGSFTYFDPQHNRIITVVPGTLPRRVSAATARLAEHFIRYPSALAPYDATFDSISVGPISITNSDTSSDRGSAPVVPGSVLQLISPLLFEGNGVTSGRNWWRAN